MTVKSTDGEFGFASADIAVVDDGIVDDVVVAIDVVGSGYEADAAPVTLTASIRPSTNVTSVVATPATAVRRCVGLLTMYLPCRSAPGSRSLPGAGRVGLRSHCGLLAPRGPGSSP